MENNGVVREVLKIGNQWEQLKQDYPKTKLFCWKGSRLQLQFVDVFVQYQLSEASLGKDVFLIFDHPFEDVFKHGINIIEEFEKGIHIWYDGLTEDQKKQKEKWSTVSDSTSIKAVNYFGVNVNSLPDYYELNSNENVVILLSPTSIYNIDYYTKWLADLIDQDFDSRVKFMMHDQAQFPHLKRVTKDLSVVSIKPNVNAMAAMQDAHEETSSDMDDPNTLFQKHLLLSGKLLGKNKTDEALNESQKCVNIAQKHDLLDSLSSAYVFRSTIYAQLDDKTGVFREIASATKSSEHNTRLFLQNMLMQGSYALRYRDKELAYTSFQETPQLAEELEDDFLVIETNRLFGIAAESIGKDKEAWDAYQVAYDVFKKMEPAPAKASTFTLVAKQMVELSEQHGNGRKEFLQETEELLGKQWWQKLKIPKRNIEESILATNTK